MGLNFTQKLGAAAPDVVITDFRTNQDADRVDDEGSAHGCSVVTVVNTEETGQYSAGVSRHLIFYVGHKAFFVMPSEVTKNFVGRN